MKIEDRCIAKCLSDNLAAHKFQDFEALGTYFSTKFKRNIFAKIMLNVHQESGQLSPLVDDDWTQQEQDYLNGICANKNPLDDDIPKIVSNLKADYQRRQARKEWFDSMKEVEADPSCDIESLIKKSIDGLEALLSGGATQDLIITQRQAMDQAIEEIERRAKGEDSCIKTPWHSLNHIMGGGFILGEFIVISSKTGEGKSSLANQMLVGLESQGLKVGVLGLEMQAGEYCQRQISQVGYELKKWDINQNNLKNPNERGINHENLQDVAKTVIKFDFIYLKPKLIDVEQMKTYCRLMVNKEKCKVLLLDHMLLVGGKMLQPEKVEEICVFLKALATEKNILCISVSQMNRDTDITAPSVSNMAGGRSIEHQATSLISIAHTKKEPVSSFGENSYDEVPDDYIRKIILVKSRSAARDRFIMTRFQGVHSRFDEILPDNWDDVKDKDPSLPECKYTYDI